MNDAKTSCLSANESQVFSLYGALFDGQNEGVSLSCFYSMLGTFGYSQEAVRLILSRMARKGLLIARRKGRSSFYFLSGTGDLITRRGGDRSVRRGEIDAWDGLFRVVTYEFPESEKDARLELVAVLKTAGFARMAPGAMAYPRSFPPEVDRALETASRRGVVERFDARLRGDPREFARRVWKLDDRRAPLDEYVRRFGSELAERRARGAGGTDAEDFAAYFRSLFDFVPAMADVPPLADELLPEDWPARRASEIFSEYRAVTRDGADRFFRTVHEPYEDAHR